jgi:ArsR family transcriptional regulator
MARPRKIDQLTDNRDDVCEERIVHVDAVRDARATLPPVAQIGALSSVFSVLADPTRLRIIASLRTGELCVCDLAAVVGQSESAVSHQLRMLREQNLVRTRKDGRRKYYALDDRHVAGLIGLALEHVAHQEHLS